jgi:hypothetical protein
MGCPEHYLLGLGVSNEGREEKALVDYKEARRTVQGLQVHKAETCQITSCDLSVY